MRNVLGGAPGPNFAAPRALDAKGAPGLIVHNAVDMGAADTLLDSTAEHPRRPMRWMSSCHRCDTGRCPSDASRGLRHHHCDGWRPPEIIRSLPLRPYPSARQRFDHRRPPCWEPILEPDGIHVWRRLTIMGRSGPRAPPSILRKWIKLLGGRYCPTVLIASRVPLYRRLAPSVCQTVAPCPGELLSLVNPSLGARE